MSEFNDSSLSHIADLLIAYLEGLVHQDLQLQETCRQLTKRLLGIAGCSEVQVRGTPEYYREDLVRALSSSIDTDVVVLELVRQMVPQQSIQHQARRAMQPLNIGHSVAVTGSANQISVKGDISFDFAPVGAQQASVHILFLSANPDDLHALHTEREARDIQEAILLSDKQARLELHFALAVRDTDIQQHFLRHEPEIVHFSSHGYPGGAIVVEDAHGKQTPIEGTLLAELFHSLRVQPRCVFLNACFSAAQAESVAQAAEVVIARPESVKDSAAILFAKIFYQTLASGGSIGEAFTSGCWQLKEQGWGRDQEPVMFSANSDPNKIRFT